MSGHKLLSPKPSLGSTLRGEPSQTHSDAEVKSIPQRSQVSLASTAGPAEDNSSRVPVNEKDVNEAEILDSRKTVHAQQSPSTDEKHDVLVVDWDGPDDPENPKKCVSSVFLTSFSVND